MLLLDGMGEEVTSAFERTEVLNVVRLAERLASSGSALVNLDSGYTIAPYAVADVHSFQQQAIETAATIEREYEISLQRR